MCHGSRSPSQHMKKLLSVLHCFQRSNKNKHSLKGGYIMYGEPDFSSLTLPELLEKARDFSEKAYSGNMSSYAFLMRAMERTLPGSTLGAEIVDLIDRVKKTNN